VVEEVENPPVKQKKKPEANAHESVLESTENEVTESKKRQRSEIWFI
jgi:hypothetical protein